MLIIGDANKLAIAIGTTGGRPIRRDSFNAAHCAWRMTDFFDGYTLRARILPAAIVLLTSAVSSAVAIPGISALAAAAGALAVALAVGVLLGELVRDKGARLESDLAGRWRGMPTTRMLRHDDAQLAPGAKAAIWELIQSQAPHIERPSAELKSRQPETADRAHEQAVEMLREWTRDRDHFPLVFAENCSYGFRRNQLSLKAWGVGSCVLGAVIPVAAIGGGTRVLGTSHANWVALALSLSVALILLVAVNAEWGGGRESATRAGCF